MTQDEIIELAREAGFKMENSAAIQAAETFATLVAAKEREACAKVCQNMTLEWEYQPEFARIELLTMMDCALAIRAKGKQA